MITAWGDRCRGGDAADVQTLMHLEPLSAISNCSEADAHRHTQGYFEGSRGGGNTVTHFSALTHFSPTVCEFMSQPEKVL